MVSLPGPPESTLLLASPVIVSLPEPPIMFSTVATLSVPAPAALPVARFAVTFAVMLEKSTVSVPLPPVTVSLPASAVMVSSPLPALMTLTAELPLMVSLPEPVVMFWMPVNVSA